MFFSIGPPIDYSKQGFLVTSTHTFKVQPTKPYNVMKFKDWLEEDRYAPKAEIDIPLDEAPVNVSIVEKFKPRPGIMSRYGLKTINNKFYGIISVDSKKSND
jgi:hypothetical protein